MFGLRAAGGLGLRRYATATATAATPRGPPSLIHPPPATISYFTGNPAYYDQLLVLNGFLRNVRQHMASLSKTLSAERFAAAEAAASTASSSAISDDWMDDASKPKLPEIPIVSQDTKLADLPLMSAFSSASTTNATQQQQQMQSPKWMSPDELLAFRSIRVSVNEYAELIKKLDILHSSKGDLYIILWYKSLTPWLYKKTCLHRTRIKQIKSLPFSLSSWFPLQSLLA